MADQLQLRGGTTSEHSTFTGALREVTVDTDKDTVVVHDGSTAGGHPLAKQNLSNVPAGTITSTMIADGTIVNADVNASAAIAGTKISPDFGSQNRTSTGTSTAASFIPSSSTVPTNGVYLPAANTVAVATNGAGRLFVDASGTSTFSGASDGVVQLTTTDSRGAFIRFGQAGSYHNMVGCADGITSGDKEDLGVRAADNIIFATGGSTERMRITSAGRVGIGTSSPQTLLHLSSATGSASPTPVELRLQTTTNASDWSTTDPWGRISFYSSDTSSSGPKIINSITSTASDTTGGSGRLEIYERTNLVASFGPDEIGFNVGGARRLHITSGGNVGIGTASPSHKLEISASGPAIQLSDTGASGQSYRLESQTGDFRINNAGVGERLRITSTGAVGIGTSSPSSRLTVVDSSSNTAGAAGAFIDINNTDGNASVVSGLRFKNGGTAAYKGAIYFKDTAGDARGDLIFATNDVASGSAEVGLSDARMTITRTGNVGIGTQSPSTTLHVESTSPATFTYSAAAAGLRVGQNTAGGQGLIVNQASGQDLYFGTNNLERARIDSSGRLLVGTSSARTVDGLASAIQVEGASAATAAIGAYRTSNDQYGAYLAFGKSRSTSLGGSAVVSSGDEIGILTFCGADGTDTNSIAARIGAYVDGTPGANDMPGRLVFSTTADGASSPTERMRIQSTGTLSYGTTNELPASNNTSGAAFYRGQGLLQMSRPGDSLALNRSSTDGNIVLFLQDGTLEGTISVSGTTVSYNGAHLSRWSQLPSGDERKEILRGTVLSNIDEMCEWGDEDNEQLNRMKVSDVEGDKNVSGVFQAWDDDDDTYTNDFYCAMTGDFIIRIAAGVTVERGDLLMSAGDGTAKPQDDDIIRSKTIAKVTSTNVSCTYDDGSYCVPCVLMAC